MSSSTTAYKEYAPTTYWAAPMRNFRASAPLHIQHTLFHNTLGYLLEPHVQVAVAGSKARRLRHPPRRHPSGPFPVGAEARSFRFESRLGGLDRHLANRGFEDVHAQKQDTRTRDLKAWTDDYLIVWEELASLSPPG
ncbi:hypothetical protein F4775DRAFT_596674 [Biscogniauxia sp. FL1348]|nr:hypothetical protein F4775DRAFT_596674 [Biscogniauxia sp. FL1348]